MLGRLEYQGLSLLETIQAKELEDVEERGSTQLCTK